LQLGHGEIPTTASTKEWSEVAKNWNN